MDTCILCKRTLNTTDDHFTSNVHSFGHTFVILAHPACLSLRALGEQARWTPGVCV